MKNTKAILEHTTLKYTGQNLDFRTTHSYPFGMPMPNRTYSLSTGSKYRFGFNGKEMDNEIYGEGNAYDFINRVADVRIGKYLSLDPLQTKYPMLSPYSVQADNPILFIDKDGKENVIYLVLVDNSVTPKQAQAIAAQATANFRALGLKTEVVYYDKKMTKESYTQLDKSDAVAVLGLKDNVLNAIHGINLRAEDFLKDQDFGESGNPEISQNTGNIIAVESKNANEFAKDVGGNATFVEAAAMCITHGRGHNAGLNHGGGTKGKLSEEGSYPSSTFANNIMSDAGTIVDLHKGFSPFINSPNNTSNMGEDVITPAQAIKAMFGNSNADAKLIDKSNRDIKFGPVMLRDE